MLGNALKDVLPLVLAAQLALIRLSGSSYCSVHSGVALAMVINFQYMPVSRLACQRGMVDVVRKNSLRFIVPKTFIQNFPGVVIPWDNGKGLS